MSTAQAWLIVGGLLNLFIGVLGAFALYWVRVREPTKPASHYALVLHRGTIMNGMLLISLSVAIQYTGFPPALNTALAIAEVLSTLLADARNMMNWAKGVEDDFAQVPEWRWRLRGLGNLIHLVVISALLYGVTRTALGL